MKYAKADATENRAEKPEPDCDTCVRRNGCARAQSGSFCTQWRSREAEPEGKDPNAAWLRGDEYADS